MIFRYLALPLVAISCVGCACPRVDTVIPLKDAQPRDLGWQGSARELPLAQCRALCGDPPGLEGCAVHPMKSDARDRDAYPRERALVCYQRSGCPGGRAPHGVELARVARTGSLAGHFWAELAQMEAVSVGSFLRLAKELRAHGAPAELFARAQRAAREEMEHAERVALLAVAEGAAVPAIPDVPLDVRSFEQVALENEVEGSVHEVWSAAALAWQFRRLPGELAGFLAPVARDEASHAVLARDVSRWAAGRLSSLLQRRLSEAADSARHALFEKLAIEPEAGLRESVGLPSAERAVDLARSVFGPAVLATR